MKTTVLFALVVMTFALPSVCLAANAIEPVPEPATGLLLLLGGAGVTAYRKLRSRNQ
jgi:hypothetical protein